MAQRPEIRVPSVLKREEIWLKKASAALTKGDIVCWVAGYILRAVNSSPKVLGLYRGDTVASSDTTNAPISVEVDEHALYVIDVTGGPLVQATHVGSDYDLSDYKTLDLGNTTYKQFTVCGLTADSTARAICKLAKPY